MRPSPSSASNTPPRLTDLKIREAERDDARQIVGLVAALSREEGQPAPALGVTDLERDGFGAHPAFQIVVAERTVRQKLVGYGLFTWGYDVASACRGAIMADLYVTPEVRRNRVGMKLMAALAQTCRAAGGRWLTWQAHAGNQNAHAFYSDIGARRTTGVPYDMGPQQMETLILKARRLP